MSQRDIVLNKGILNHVNTKDRIVTDYERIRKLVEHCRGLGIKIVLTQGTFDMVHIGHGRYLDEAKRYGDLLIVGIDNDEKVTKRKGSDRPVVPENERLEMLTYIRPVDLVFLKKLQDPKWKLIKTVKPDVLVTIGENYSDKQRKELGKYCGEVKVLKKQATTSTSAKLRLLQMGVAQKLGQSLTPKLINALEEALSEVKGMGGAKTAQSKQSGASSPKGTQKKKQ